MKVASIIPKLYGGGAEKVAANMSFFWSDSVHHDFILFERVERPYAHKGGVHSLEEPNRTGKVKKIVALYRRFIKIKKEKRNYSITLSHLFVPNILNALSGGKTKSVLVIHGPASLYQNSLEKQLAYWAYKKADYVVSVSKYFEHYAKQKLKIPPHRIKTIYNPMDLALIKELKTEKLTQEEEAIFAKPVFINVGRISKQKGQWHAIKAFAEIQKSEANAQLVFLGEGDVVLKDKMLQYVRSYELEDHVHFFGNVSNPYKYLSRAFALFYTSLWDALPTVIIEAMACGLPVISSDCDSGPREILAPETDYLKRTQVLEKIDLGYLCPKCTVSDDLGLSLSKQEKYFSEAGIDLLGDNVFYKKIQQNGIKRAQDFGGEHIIIQYEDLFRKILEHEA